MSRGRGKRGLALAVLLASGTLGAREEMKRSTRFEIIRSLSSEVAVAKVLFPRGKHGISLNDKGQVDQAKANAELKANGAAIRAGMPIEITRLTFKNDRIVFEINGGGRKGKKWYQRIEVGMGTQTRPVVQDAPVLAYGSWVSLVFPKQVPELTPQQVKQLLGTVLDFERHSPTVLYSPTVPPRIKEAIKKHEVVVGMDHDAVLSAKGPPDRKVREVREGVEKEEWIYGFPPHVLFVTFDGDTVVSVRQY